MRETKIDLLAKICPLIFDKGTTAIQWKDNLQNMVLQQLDINRTKESSTLVLTSYTKIKQITDFKVKFETIKFQKKDRRKYSGSRARQQVLRLRLKVKSMKENEGNFIKIKNVCSMEDPVKIKTSYT